MPASPTDIAYRVGGTVVGVLLAIATALWEAMLTPLYVTHGSTVIRLPIAPILAIITNVAIVWFTVQVTELPLLALIPGIAWSAVIFVAGSLTSEGDLLILGNWVGIMTTFLGSIAWAVALYVLIMRRAARTRAAVPTPPPTPTRRPAKR